MFYFEFSIKQAQPLDISGYINVFDIFLAGYFEGRKCFS